MALTHLVDASVLTRVSAELVRARMASLADEGHLGRCAITDLEIGYSARNEREWDDLAEALEALEFVEVTPAHVARAVQVQRILAGRSQRGRKIPDLLVAAVAEAGGLTVLHYDAGFDRIAAVTGQSCEWICPAGGLDLTPRRGERGEIPEAMHDALGRPTPSARRSSTSPRRAPRSPR